MAIKKLKNGINTLSVELHGKNSNLSKGSASSNNAMVSKTNKSVRAPKTPEEGKHREKETRGVTPVKSAGYHISFATKGKRRANKDSSLNLLWIEHNGATAGRPGGAWEKEDQTDEEMEPVEETEIDLVATQNRSRYGGKLARRNKFRGDSCRTKE
eukprot:14105969-Ditylum_brightwellii.AAC.1